MDGNIAQSVLELLADNDPTAMTEREFLGARFDKGLAWVNYPGRSGWLGRPKALPRRPRRPVGRRGRSAPTSVAEPDRTRHGRTDDSDARQ